MITGLLEDLVVDWCVSLLPRGFFFCCHPTFSIYRSDYWYQSVMSARTLFRLFWTEISSAWDSRLYRNDWMVSHIPFFLLVFFGMFFSSVPLSRSIRLIIIYGLIISLLFPGISLYVCLFFFLFRQTKGKINKILSILYLVDGMQTKQQRCAPTLPLSPTFYWLLRLHLAD